MIPPGTFTSRNGSPESNRKTTSSQRSATAKLIRSLWKEVRSSYLNGHGTAHDNLPADELHYQPGDDDDGEGVGQDAGQAEAGHQDSLHRQPSRAE